MTDDEFALILNDPDIPLEVLFSEKQSRLAKGYASACALLMHRDCSGAQRDDDGITEKYLGPCQCPCHKGESMPTYTPAKRFNDREEQK